MIETVNAIAIDMYEENFCTCNEKEQESVLEEFAYQLMNDNLEI